MSILAPNSHILYREIHQRNGHCHHGGSSSSLVLLKSYRFSFGGSKKRIISSKDLLRVYAFSPDLSRPTTVEMKPIHDSDQLDQILVMLNNFPNPSLLIGKLRLSDSCEQPKVMMASWCRKCIYLKPKLEKMAAEFDTKLKFYCVDVNKVPQALVKRGNISKMPTIQLWKDGEMKEEVIGGHRASLVIDEVRAMIQKFV